MFDSSCAMSMTFFCFEEAPVENDLFCQDMMCPYKVSSFDDVIKEKGSSFPLRLQGVRVRPVTVADVQKCYKLLNIQDQPIKDLRVSVVNLFHYLCSHKFNTKEAINEFCKRHQLAHFVNFKWTFFENVIAFRNFFNVVFPIKLSPVDGQHRLLSTVIAFERNLLSDIVPVHYLNNDETELPPSSHIFDKVNVTWLFSDDLPHLWMITMDHSIAMNKSGKSYIESNFANKISRKLDFLWSSSGEDFRALVSFFHEQRFTKSFEKGKSKFIIGGKTTTNLPFDFYTNVQYGFAESVSLIALAQAGQISTYTSWQPNHKSKKFESWVKLLLHADAVFGWASRLKASVPVTYCMYVEPLIHAPLSLEITKHFCDIYNQGWIFPQQRLIDQTSRPDGHIYKVDNHSLGNFLEFIYHGFQRPVDYIVHFLTNYVVQFTTCLRIFNSSPEWKKIYYDLKGNYGSDVWKMLPQLIDPPCYWKHLQEVDDYHFPGMYSEDTPFSHLARKLTDGSVMTLHRHSLLRNHKELVDTFFDSKFEKSSTYLDKQGYQRFSMAVWTAVYNQILPVIAQYGMNPMMKKKVGKQTLKVISRYVFFSSFIFFKFFLTPF